MAFLALEPSSLIAGASLTVELIEALASPARLNSAGFGFSCGL
ncbi:MAG: hypothetical protein QXF69_06205 [Thermofilaceae archaeon]